ncbi:MAG: hypothetical protein ACKVOQ_06480 [Cyclobacteriaceae bacterium]
MKCTQEDSPSDNYFLYLYNSLKRLLSISLLALYLNSFTEVHEILRLPILFEHYAEHKEQVNDMSFVEFLAMHYKTDVAHDDHDNQLPFKVPGHSFAVQAFALPIQKIIVFETTPLATVSHSFQYTEVSFSSHLEAIFQPPRHT